MKSASKPIPIKAGASPSRPPRPPTTSAAFARSVPNAATTVASSHHRKSVGGTSLAAPHLGSLKTPHSLLDEMPALALDRAEFDEEAGGLSPPPAFSQSLPPISLAASLSRRSDGNNAAGSSLSMSLSQMKILDGGGDGAFNDVRTDGEEERATILTRAQEGFKTREQIEAEEEASFARSLEEEEEEEHFGVRFRD